MRFEDLLYSEKLILQNWFSLLKFNSSNIRQHLRVDEAELERYAHRLDARGKRLEHWTVPGIHPESDDNFARFTLVTSAVNFAFWLPEDPRRKYEVANPSGAKPYSGAFAMARRFFEVFGDTPMTAERLEPYFKTMETTREFFRGITDIPFLEWRYWNMRELISVLKEKFGGDPLRVYEAAQYDVPLLIHLLVSIFPMTFGSDVSHVAFMPGQYGAFTFPFYKRAKLAAVLYQGRALKTGSKLRQLSRINSILAVQDYEVPKSLRANGPLVYGEGLARKVDNREIIWPHGVEEVLIRAATSEINYGILQLLPDWDILPLDYAEWSDGKDSPYPHHLTPTSAY
ncbi:MAG: hypothetical protein HY456_02240 [Parcubacteria group bacterium]|nr:hypothetical protein [Parcubacteria group bacterium]